MKKHKEETDKDIWDKDISPRKKRRIIENDAYAKDARYWRGKPKSADRLLYDKPVNKQASKIIRVFPLTILLGALSIFVASSEVRAAPGSSDAGICLTKRQARELWPKKHIYWYSKHHCWSDRRGPPKNPKIDPVLNKAYAARSQVPTPKQVFDKSPLPQSHKVIDIDDYLRNNCCWPILDKEKEPDDIMVPEPIDPPPPRPFAERWNDLIDVFRSVRK